MSRFTMSALPLEGLKLNLDCKSQRHPRQGHPRSRHSEQVRF